MDSEQDQASAEIPESAEPTRHHKKRTGMAALALGALGVVFGDIGTSPLYSMQTVFAIENRSVLPDRVDVFGIISLVFWAVTIVVSVKYLTFVMRADNDGEGGILALVALLRDRLQGHKRLVGIATLLGILGAALFYGDSLITPAISVMSAIEGLSLVNPAAEDWVLPASMSILTVLFFAQRFGTEKIGRTFGPIMSVWFLTIAVLGIPHIVANPEILGALSPHHALYFATQRPLIAFIAFGAIVLCITGAEALYADMGHFGKRPIKAAWFCVVFPALMLNYFGQGAMILRDPSAAENPFFRLAPTWAVVPLVILATVATVIASQSVISGAFSVTRQATRLGLLPRMNIRHTSKREGGQIYIAQINWMLYFGILALILFFKSSANLANAYGLAVTGTELLTSTIFLFLARNVWGWKAWQMISATVVFIGLELTFLTANFAKILHGGWLPLLVAGVLVTLMLTWRRGHRERIAARARFEGPLDAFIEKIRRIDIPRVQGVAVFPHPNQQTVPLALKENLRFNRVLHETIIIVTVVNENVPHVPHVERASINNLGYDDDGIFHISYRVGFNDSQDIPAAVHWGHEMHPEMEFDPHNARYFLSVLRLQKKNAKSTMPRWQREVFFVMAKNEASRTEVFHLPPERTVLMGSPAEL